MLSLGERCNVVYQNLQQEEKKRREEEEAKRLQEEEKQADIDFNDFVQLVERYERGEEVTSTYEYISNRELYIGFRVAYKESKSLFEKFEKNNLFVFRVSENEKYCYMLTPGSYTDKGLFIAFKSLGYNDW